MLQIKISRIFVMQFIDWNSLRTPILDHGTKLAKVGLIALELELITNVFLLEKVYINVKLLQLLLWLVMAPLPACVEHWLSLWCILKNYLLSFLL